MLIVGLNSSGYVSSAAVVVDGKLAFACAEERLDRRKFSKYFPINAIKAGLDHVGATFDDVDIFAVGYNPAISVASRPRVGFSEWPGYPGYRFSSNPNYLLPMLRPTDWRETEQNFLSDDGKQSRILYVDHHLAHAANAFLLSGETDAATMTCDGYGERACATWGVASPKGIDILQRTDFPHSIGCIYSTITQFLGFSPNADEWKTMGASAYGNSERFVDAMRETLNYDKSGNLEVDFSFYNYFDFDVAPMYRPKLEKLLGKARQTGEELKQRHYDIAAALQALTEDYLGIALNQLHKTTGAKTACLSGGVMMNSVFNGKAALNSPFEKIYLPFAPDDNGNSIGAALWAAWQSEELTPGHHINNSPYLGRAYSNEEIQKILDNCRLTYQFYDDIIPAAVELLTAGQVLGWFQGRMEFGDRALGNRSILADPRDPTMKDKINKKIKYRESFRPFAPAILEEDQHRYLSSESTVSSPYMDKAVSFKSDFRNIVPSVVHADGSARIQTLSEGSNALFYQLINAFKQKTGIPMLLNTSFNVAGEPIVESPTDAIRTFFGSGLDVLVIGNYILYKSGRKG